MSLRVLAAKYSLGMVYSDDLPDIAAGLLLAGVASQSVLEWNGTAARHG